MLSSTSHTRFWWGLTGAIIAALGWLGSVTAQPGLNGPTLPPPPGAPVPSDATEQNPDAEVLTRGAVHEAFAEAIQVEATVNPVVVKQPPEAIEEVPPDVRPEGDNIVWVPGYWGWDDDRKDFVWLSGTYRNAPPNRSWVPGYWAQAGNGWQRVSGFWAMAQAQQVEYLPEPPATLDNGPPEVEVRENEYWVNGCWTWRSTRYVWRPGYWTAVNPDWLWVPDHHCWTPSGYVYVAGYWDYPVVRRGVLFAPVYFHRPIYLQQHYAWRPSVVIEANLFSTHLWYRPRHCSYYFGDYYGASYVSLGYTPWHSSWHRHYDPMFSYYRASRGSSWAVNISIGHAFYAQHSDYRPPHTYAAQRDWHDRIASRPIPQVVNIDNRQVNVTNITNITNVKNTTVAANIHDVAKRQDKFGDVKFQKVNADTQQQLTRQLQDVRATQGERAKFETKSPVAKSQPVPGFDLKNKSSGAARLSNSGDTPNFGQRGRDFGKGPDGDKSPKSLTGIGPNIDPKPGVNTGRELPGRDAPGRNPIGRDNTPRLTAPNTINPPTINPGAMNPGANNPGKGPDKSPLIKAPESPRVNPTLPGGNPNLPGKGGASDAPSTPRFKPAQPNIVNPPAPNPAPRILPGTGGNPGVLPGNNNPPKGNPGGPPRGNPGGGGDKDKDKDRGKRAEAAPPMITPPVITAPKIVTPAPKIAAPAPRLERAPQVSQPAAKPPAFRTNPQPTVVAKPPVTVAPKVVQPERRTVATPPAIKLPTPKAVPADKGKPADDKDAKKNRRQ